MMSLDIQRRKKRSKIWEKCYPYFLFILYIILVNIPYVNTKVSSYVNDTMSLLDYRDLISQIMTVESILFGFLLTVLAITIQTNTSAILNIKKAGRFNDLISYNKQAVYMSFITVSVSLLLYLLPYKNIDLLFFLSLFGLTFLSLVLSFRYIRLFFIIIKE